MNVLCGKGLCNPKEQKAATYSGFFYGNGSQREYRKALPGKYSKDSSTAPVSEHFSTIMGTPGPGYWEFSILKGQNMAKSLILDTRLSIFSDFGGS